MSKRTIRMRKEGRISTFEAFMQYVWLSVMPAVFGALLYGEGGEEEDEEPTDTAIRLTKQSLLYPLSGLVGVRDLASFVEFSYFGFSTPVLEGIESIGRALMAIDDIWDEDEELNDVDIKNMILGIGYLFGLPSRQAANMVGEALDDGEFSIWEFLVKHKKDN